jgi:hypothetical protein
MKSPTCTRRRDRHCGPEALLTGRLPVPVAFSSPRPLAGRFPLLTATCRHSLPADSSTSSTAFTAALKVDFSCPHLLTPPRSPGYRALPLMSFRMTRVPSRFPPALSLLEPVDDTPSQHPTESRPGPQRCPKSVSVPRLAASYALHQQALRFPPVLRDHPSPLHSDQKAVSGPAR